MNDIRSYHPPRTGRWAPPPPVPMPRPGPWGPPPSLPPAGLPPAGLPGSDGRPWMPYPPPPRYAHPGGPNPGGSSPLPIWLWVALGLVCALIVGVGAMLLWPSRDEPAEVASDTAGQVEGWSGVTYRSVMTDSSGGTATLEITVDRSGNARGTLTQPSGERAEIAIVKQTQYVKADRTWWLGSSRSEIAERLSDEWLRGPFPGLSGLTSVAKPPASVAAQLRAPGHWTEGPEQTVDGTLVRTLVSEDASGPGGDRRILVSADEPHRLLALELPAGDAGQLRAFPADPGAVAAISGLPAELSGAPSYTQKLVERPRVAVSIQPPALCLEPTCTATVTLTNSGTSPLSGTVEVTADGKPVATHPFTAAPGQTVSYPATAPNPMYGTDPGAQREMHWYARAVPLTR